MTTILPCSACDLFKYPCNTETTVSEATMAKYAEGCVGLRLAACSFGTSQGQSRTQIEAPSSAFFRDRSSRQSIHTISWPDAVQESVRAGAVIGFGTGTGFWARSCNAASSLRSNVQPSSANSNPRRLLERHLMAHFETIMQAKALRRLQKAAKA